MPTTTTPPRPFRRVIAAAAAALLLSLGGLMVAAPASAHDELVSTDPAADAVLDALPPQLTLTFSGELATDPGATELQVTDAAGTSLADGDPLVEGTVVTQPLSGAASGVVTVLWKVVSSDGHPISGEFAFSVPTAPTPTPTPTATATASPSETPVENATPAPVETAVPVDSGAASLPWLLLAVIGVALLGGVTYLLVSRARRQKALEAASAAGPAEAPAPHSPPPADR
jgi:methionine-rich copper-binding protein CopC